jgi:toxin ParE1/3/4
VTPPRIVLRQDAIDDIDETSDYIARDNLDAARRFRATVREEIRSLSEMPGMGARREFDNPRLKEVRSWPVKHFMNYLIFYRPIEDGIEVLRVLHGARDIDRIFRGGIS